jgi:hypothetical protein
MVKDGMVEIFMDDSGCICGGKSELAVTALKKAKNFGHLKWGFGSRIHSRS